MRDRIVRALVAALLTAAVGACDAVTPTATFAQASLPPLPPMPCDCICVDGHGCAVGSEFDGSKNNGTCNYSKFVDTGTCSTGKMTCAVDATTLWNTVLVCSPTPNPVL